MNGQLTCTELERIAAVLAALVREEYPRKCSLAEIASTWGGRDITAGDIDALERYEGRDG